MRTEKKTGPNVEFVVKVTSDDGMVVEKAVQTSADLLPAPQDFGIMIKEDFLRDFDKVETFRLEGREQFTDAAFGAYMQTVKKRIHRSNHPESARPSKAKSADWNVQLAEHWELN